jgi:hypothetical protein
MSQELSPENTFFGPDGEIIAYRTDGFLLKAGEVLYSSDGGVTFYELPVYEYAGFTNRHSFFTELNEHRFEVDRQSGDTLVRKDNHTYFNRREGVAFPGADIIPLPESNQLAYVGVQLNQMYVVVSMNAMTYSEESVRVYVGKLDQPMVERSVTRVGNVRFGGLPELQVGELSLMFQEGSMYWGVSKLGDLNPEEFDLAFYEGKAILTMKM